MEHPTYPRPPQPLVEKNPFRQQKYTPQAIPVFSEARSQLPVPILPDHPEWVEMYWRAWEIAWSNLHRPKPGSGFVANYIDAAFNENTFMWDTAFMTQFGVYGRRAFSFIDSLNNFYAKQHDDGFICREINMEAGYDFFPAFDPDATGPNVLAWAEWRYYRISGDDGRFADVFWPLLAYHQWMRANRTWPSGLYWATGLSSGMDNQTRVPDSSRHHRHWTWVDASVQAALNCFMLARMATLLGEGELARELEAERRTLHQLINRHLWNDKLKFYQDVDPQGHFSMVKSIGAYWALLDDELAPADRLEPFVQHLREKGVFKTPHRVPSQSADSEGYDAETGAYWRGGVWPPTNFMVLKGLHSVGQHALAHEIARNHLGNVCTVYQHTDTFWENYAPETAAPGSPAKPNFVGWTGLSAVAVLFEDVIGLYVDWPQRRVIWHRYLDVPRHYGVLNYPLGPEGKMEILGGAEKVVVTTNVPFTLTIRAHNLSLQAPVAAGTTEIDLS